jgi:hypothetical protein
MRRDAEAEAVEAASHGPQTVQEMGHGNTLGTGTKVLEILLANGDGIAVGAPARLHGSALEELETDRGSRLDRAMVALAKRLLSNPASVLGALVTLLASTHRNLSAALETQLAGVLESCVEGPERPLGSTRRSSNVALERRLEEPLVVLLEAWGIQRASWEDCLAPEKQSLDSRWMIFSWPNMAYASSNSQSYSAIVRVLSELREQQRLDWASQRPHRL